jgi:hypothetical protein
MTSPAQAVERTARVDPNLTLGDVALTQKQKGSKNKLAALLLYCDYLSLKRALSEEPSSVVIVAR